MAANSIFVIYGFFGTLFFFFYLSKMRSLLLGLKKMQPFKIQHSIHN